MGCNSLTKGHPARDTCSHYTGLSKLLEWSLDAWDPQSSAGLQPPLFIAVKHAQTFFFFFFCQFCNIFHFRLFHLPSSGHNNSKYQQEQDIKNEQFYFGNICPKCQIKNIQSPPSYKMLKYGRASNIFFDILLLIEINLHQKKYIKEYNASVRLNCGITLNFSKERLHLRTAF